jgi:signal transduction histidine kinase
VVGKVRALQVGSVLTVGAIGCRTAWVGWTTTWPVFGGSGRWHLVSGLAAAAALVATAVPRLGSARDRVAGGLLVASAASWLLTAWDDPELSSGSFVVGRLLHATWPLLLAHGLLRLDGRPTRLDRVVLSAGYAATLGLAGLATTVVFDPVSSGCGDCPTNPLLLLTRPRVASALQYAADLSGPVWSVLLLVALAHRLLTAPPARRRTTAAVLVVGLAILLMTTAGYVQAVSRGPGQGAGADPSTSQAVFLLLLPLASGWPRLSLTLTRRRLARLVVEVASRPSVGRLGRAVALAMHDSSARLLYPRRPGSDELIDADGERAEHPILLTPLIRGSATVAYLDHRAPILAHEAGTVAQMAQLSIDHERLHAQHIAQLRELRESRVRIVARMDASRRRLERDLHDGAQQQLVSLALALRLAGIHTPEAAGVARLQLARVEEEVGAAMAELRTIARGIYPRELADEGLAAALEAFADADPTPLGLELDLPCRPPADVEAAAFFAVASTLSTTEYRPVSGRGLSARLQGGSLRLDLHGTSDVDLEALEDRIGSVDGSVERVDDTWIRIELPCAS